MTERRKTRDELLAQLADHISELVDPIEHAERYLVRSKTGHRRIARVHRSAHPCLLDQLREAALRGHDDPSPANLDAMDRLVTIHADLARWARLLKVWRYDPSPPTTKGAMRALVGAVAPARVPRAEIARLAGDVARWRTWCRVLGAWEDPIPHLPTVPCPRCDTLPGERAGLRIRLDRSAAVCLTCQATWDEDTAGLLAEHIRACLAKRRAGTWPCGHPITPDVIRDAGAGTGTYCPVCGASTDPARTPTRSHGGRA